MSKITELEAQLEGLAADREALYEKEYELLEAVRTAHVAEMAELPWPHEFEIELPIADVLVDNVYDHTLDTDMADDLYDTLEEAHVLLKIRLEQDGTFVVTSMERVGF